MLLFATLALVSAQETPLRIDPRLLAQAAEVWGVVASDDNPVWPGWNAAETPLLFYFPGEQEVLVNHPRPPASFRPYAGPIAIDGWDIRVHDGETLFTLDGQNTTRTVAGVQTLVVADTLSNKRPTWRMLLSDPEAELGLDVLSSDPYGQMGTIAHEAFHAFQTRWSEGKTASETLLLHYPVLDVENEVGVALEARALADALAPGTAAELEAAALRWLAVRKDRRARLPAEAIAYEDGTEFNEGLATYVEYALSYALEGREPGPGMAWVRGFRGFGDLAFVRERLVEDMRAFLSGERVVNDDPYGTAPVRYRLYYSGMAIGALLDELDPEWKERIMEPETTLTGLVEEALAPTAAMLDEALAAMEEHPDRAALVAEKTRLRAEGRRIAEEKVQAILSGANGLVTIDYSALGAPPAAWGYTPFGLTPVDDDRVIYGMVPVSARFDDGSAFRQSAVSPVLHDASARTVRFQLAGPLEANAAPSEGVVADEVLELPGATLHLRKARLTRSGSGLNVELLES